MAVVQTNGPKHLWNNLPRAIFLGERGSRVLLLRSGDPAGPVLAEERRSEVFAPVWALQEEFPGEMPRTGGR
jgi:hypothetical protein